jgi:hypothetical protein
MRQLWPESCRYRLNGENDKAGYPDEDFKELKPKPDLLVHEPGTKDYDYAVIEVKSSRATPNQIRKDLRTLCRFVKFGYERAIYLVYGDEAVLERLCECYTTINVGIQKTAHRVIPKPIAVWFHPAAGDPATRRLALRPPLPSCC